MSRILPLGLACRRLAVAAALAGCTLGQGVTAEPAPKAIAIPSDFDYRQVGGLSAEACDVMMRLRPETIGQANRLPGLTPAAVMAVLRHLKRAPAPERPAPECPGAGRQAAGPA